MCGIAGLLGPGARDPDIAARMIGTLAHRGPNDQGVWTDPQPGVALAHRRLAIIDLSPAGHQPMASANGRYILNFNGEVYNHSEVRAAIEQAGCAPENGWRGHSDTETLVEAIAAWGLEAALRRCVGMFALAIWDKKERKLLLARDRFGEKPLYYGWAGEDFVFASELKALRAHPRFDRQVDRLALQHYVQRGYVPAPRSIYHRVFKLQPASILSVAPRHTPTDAPVNHGDRADGLSLDRYWDYAAVVDRGVESPVTNEAEALDELEHLLGRAVQEQSLADVPVGAFLSGGIDSSLIVALAQKRAVDPVRTFSIGFEEAAYNEADAAAAVAAHLGTDHHEQIVTVQQARDVIPLLPTMYDEPFADSSQIPTFLVSRFASGEVTVALTGDAGDELFGGYNRHIFAPRLWQRVAKLPLPVRTLAAASLATLPRSFWSGASRMLAGQGQANFAEKLQKAVSLSGSARSFGDLYADLLNEWSSEPSPVLGGPGNASDGRYYDLDCSEGASDAVRAMYCDATAYLPDDVLCKVDRASMAVSLETRVPFLDHRVAEYAARIPVELKISGGRGKAVLRKLLYRHVPRELVDRPKAGFAIPVGEWLKGPLRPWAEELLDPARMAAEGWLDPRIVQRRWKDHLAGRADSTSALWAILMFQAWLRSEQDELRAAA